MFGPITRGVILAGLILTGCGESEQAAKPAPQDLTREAIGHYCNMIVADHLGPKAQIFLRTRAEPVWFTQVRDAIAFTLLPDEPKNLAAVYVNDMARADWDRPEPGTWIEAREAVYVIGSARRGGMGALEAVPFGDPEAAHAFAARHGGRVVAYADIPVDYILSSDDDDGEAAHDGSRNHATH